MSAEAAPCVATLRAVTLRHIHKALAPGGFLLLFEAMDETPAHIFGLDERIWTYTDEREYALWIPKRRWHKLLAQAGLSMVAEHWCEQPPPPTCILGNSCIRLLAWPECAHPYSQAAMLRQPPVPIPVLACSMQ